MFRAGVCSIFSKLAQDDRIVVIDGLSIEAPKTKLLADKLKAMGLESALIITDSMDDNLYLASRNLKNILVVEPRYADPLSLIHYKKVVVTKPAMAKLEEMWGQA
jgi:large subunit ribosomal protein L4